MNLVFWKRGGLLAALFSLSAARAVAQAPLVPPASTPAVPSPAVPSPAVPSPAVPSLGDSPLAPIDTTPIPAPPPFTALSGGPVRTLTLDQVLALALGDNSSVRLAREKVNKAQQLISEADAGGLPTVRVDIVDTYSGNRTFGTASGGSNATGTLPGGGQIPVIVDQGGGNTGAITSSGGGGTATGAGATSFSSVSTSAGSSGGTTGTTNSVPTNSTGGTGGTSGTGGTGTTGTGTTGTGTTGTTTGTGTAGPQVRGDSGGDLPPIMQQYASATKGGTAAAKPRAGTTGTGTGTGTGDQPGNGSTNNNFSGGYHNNYSGRLSISQGVDLFNLVPAARDVERITRDFYVTDLERVQNETALSVKDQFFNVLRDQAQVDVYTQQVAADTENVRVSQARVTAGAAAQYDLLTAQTTLSNAQQQLSSARNTLTLAEVNLNNLVGLAPDTPISLQEPALPPITQTFDRTRLTRTALTSRPEVRQADNNIVIAQRLVRLAGVGLLPSLSFVGSANTNGHVSGSSPHQTVSLSAVLGIPLYDGGDTRAKIKEAQADLRSQQITRDQLQQNVSVEVLQALSNINDAQTRASSAGLGAQQAAEALRLANVRYQNGIGTILDVVNAEAQLAQARTNLLNAQYDYQTSLAQLTRAIGGR